MSRPAVRAIARHEWSRRMRALLLLGALTGLFGGLIVTATALTRRTATAPDRLHGAVSPGVAKVQVFGGSDLADRIAALPGVDRTWPGGIAVGRVEGRAVTYLGLVAGPARGPDLLRPVLLDGREADPGRADEVMLLEGPASTLGVGAGDHLRVAMLTGEEVSQFDVGFGEPDGPTLDLLVTGIGRVPRAPRPAHRSSPPPRSRPATATSSPVPTSSSTCATVAVDWPGSGVRWPT